jgi:hypothetical protein
MKVWLGGPVREGVVDLFALFTQIDRFLEGVAVVVTVGLHPRALISLFIH